MAKKVKPQSDIIPVESFDQVDDLLHKIGSLADQIDKINIDNSAKIEQLKAEAKLEIEPLQLELDQLAESIKAFCVSNKKTFGTRQSMTLNHGKVGWRKSTVISIKTKNDTTLKLIKSLFKPALIKDCIITKESVSKDALAKLSDDQLAQVEAKRVPKNPFYVEPVRTEVKA